MLITFGFLEDWDTEKFIKLFPGRPDIRLTHEQYKNRLNRALTSLSRVISFGDKQEIENAVRYAFVALDAEKHQLDIDSAAKALNFPEIEKKYLAYIREQSAV